MALWHRTAQRLRRASLARTRRARQRNALAESVIGLFKTEVVRREGPWKNVEDVEFATLKWVWWYNHHRLLGPIGHVPPAEFEEQYYSTLEAPANVGSLNSNSLR